MASSTAPQLWTRLQRFEVCSILSRSIASNHISGSSLCQTHFKIRPASRCDFVQMEQIHVTLRQRNLQINARASVKVIVGDWGSLKPSDEWPPLERLVSRLPVLVA